MIEPEYLSFHPAEEIAATAVRNDDVANGLSLKAIDEPATADAEQHAIRRVLQATKGNKSEAARLLRTDYKTLHLKMKQYSISAAAFRDVATLA